MLSSFEELKEEKIPWKTEGKIGIIGTRMKRK
jgi:hypothetical protein